jgi:transcriptional regulator with XRE-family HTH domain
MLGETATTGIQDLDLALGGLYWGDNVVWAADEGASVDPFLAAIAVSAPEYHYAGYVTLRDPEPIAGMLSGFDVVDARPGTPHDSPESLIRHLRTACDPNERDLFIFDSIDLMAENWGEEPALRFFTKTCPALLELGAIAYWSITPTRHAAATRHEIEDVTQCIVEIGNGRLRIAKAEGRSFGIQGAVFRYRVDGGTPELETAPTAARLGAALRAIRIQRNLSQSGLARLAGVSASAISQAERGRRGLSLDTLLELTSRLNVTLDELLRGEAAPGYRLARRHDPARIPDGTPVALADDPQAGLRAYVVRIPPDGQAELGFVHKGVELIAVAHGLVQVILPTGRPVLRSGETLLAERSGISSCRNLSSRDATVFWILRDEIEERPQA